MHPRTHVKICGITNIEDALLAAELGADALGFIFVPASPRSITPDAAATIIRRLPPFVTTVAVVVNDTADDVRTLMRASGCQVAQLHGDETPDYLTALGYPAMKAVSVATVDDLTHLAAYADARAFLLDTKVAGLRGGTGLTFDWTVARAARTFGKPVVLAGGLTPENIGEAIRVSEADAVDVSSGIERAPGCKDHPRLRALFAAITASSAW